MSAPVFDEAQNRELNEYVFKAYYATRRIRRIAYHIFSMRLPQFERKQRGLCKPVTASHEQIAREVFARENPGCDPKTVGPSLVALREAGLIEYAPGERGPGHRAASIMRRRTLEEIQYGNPKNLIEPPIWPDAARLAQLLSRPITFGEKSFTPRWYANRIGRVHQDKCHAAAYIQDCPRDKREAAYLSGMTPGRVLVNCDIKQAEPRVIRELLKIHSLALPGFPQDPYQNLASALSIERDEAKELFNSIAYSMNPISHKYHFAKYGSRLAWALDYANAVVELRKRIRIEAKDRYPPFSVLTLRGRLIHPLKEERPHNGKLLAWIAQASIADAVVPACLEIIEREDETGWRLLSNMHDGFFVDAASDEQAEELERILSKHARDAKIGALEIKTSTVRREETTPPTLTPPPPPW